jgi:hypothetical protein
MNDTQIAKAFEEWFASKLRIAPSPEDCLNLEDMREIMQYAFAAAIKLLIPIIEAQSKESMLNDEDLLRTHMNRIGYNKMESMRQELELTKKMNVILKNDLSFLTQPLTPSLTLDDVEECFKMLRQKHELAKWEGRV